MIRLRLSLIPVLFAVLSTGCEPASTPAPTFTVRDSAGIEIAESLAPLFGPDAWAISEEPLLQIGGREGDEHFLFTRIVACTRLPDGRIAVLDWGDRTVRFFDQAGEYVSQFGGEGAGPGEVQSFPRGLIQVDGGLGVLEQGRISFFDEYGQYVERRDLNLPGPATEMVGVFPDLSVLVRTAIQDPHFLLNPEPGVLPQTGEVWTLSAAGQSSEWRDTVHTDRMVAWEDSRGLTGRALQPFGGTAVLVVFGEEWVYGWSDAYELKVFDRGDNLKRIIRRKWEPEPVTAENRTWFVESGGPSGDQGFPDHHPAFTQLLVDGLGYFWVRRPPIVFDSQAEFISLWQISPFPLEWDVFGPSGAWVTSVTLPAGVQVQEIGEDYILGVWKDEMDVEFVRMYSLNRGD